MFKKLDKIKSRYLFLEEHLHNFSSSVSQTERVAFTKEYVSLGKVVALYKKYQEIIKDFQTYKNVVDNQKEEKELIFLAKEELILLKLKKDEIFLKLKHSLIPPDPLDKNNIIMELRPAAGGDEASLFCEDLFMMYLQYINKKSWQVEIASSIKGNNGGFKEVIFLISGQNVYKNLKQESGVHRVQRVPQTETQGRIHTSTVTVVVLPSIDVKTIKINPADIRIDTFRSSGSGGQHVNTTDSAIRVVHIPTQTIVQCQDGKSQHANKDKALKVLYARLYDLEEKKKRDQNSQKRLSQIGTGDRSEKIRTYNFPQSRVTDHRTGTTFYNLEFLMSSGELDPFIEAYKKKQTELFFKNQDASE